MLGVSNDAPVQNKIVDGAPLGERKAEPHARSTHPRCQLGWRRALPRAGRDQAPQRGVKPDSCGGGGRVRQGFLLQGTPSINTAALAAQRSVLVPS